MTQTRHIVSAFDEDLRSISARLSEMGGLVEEQLASAIKALGSRDSELAQEVISSDRRLDALETQLEQHAIEVMALRQPMASDLRAVVAGLKISSTLERMGDLAKNIAKRTIILNQNDPLRMMGSITRMGKLTQSLTAEALSAYSAQDTKRAVAVWKSDLEVDEMHNSIFRELTTYMMEDPRTIGLCSQLMFVVKNLERIGDHATFVAEMTYYVVEGKPLPDDRPKSNEWDEIDTTNGTS